MNKWTWMNDRRGTTQFWTVMKWASTSWWNKYNEHLKKLREQKISKRFLAFMNIFDESLKLATGVSQMVITRTWFPEQEEDLYCSWWCWNKLKTKLILWQTKSWVMYSRTFPPDATSSKCRKVQSWLQFIAVPKTQRGVECHTADSISSCLHPIFQASTGWMAVPPTTR